MAKVGIMSMQRIANYGSFLQAYGLKAILEELGHEVCFVDYHVEMPLVLKGRKIELRWKRTAQKVWETMSYNAPLVQKFQYILYKKNFGAKYHATLGLSTEPNYQSQLDTLLIGSDEVFNCVQENLKVGYSTELFGKGNQANRLISYAASFGNTTLEKLEQYKKTEEVGRMLKDFNAISVRDENSGKIIKKLLGIEPDYHFDPVLVYDFMQRCEMIPEINKKDKYLLLYAYSGRISTEEAEWIRTYAKSKNLKTYALGGIHKFVDRFIDCSPFEVLAYFKNAQEIITDTFHGTIFSVVTERPFISIVRKSVGNFYGNEEKLCDLLKRLSLQERAVINIKKAGDLLGLEIDYMRTNQIRERERQKAINYLSRQVGCSDKQSSFRCS